VFARSTWVALGVLTALLALQVGYELPTSGRGTPLDARTAAQLEASIEAIEAALGRPTPHTTELRRTILDLRRRPVSADPVLVSRLAAGMVWLTIGLLVLAGIRTRRRARTSRRTAPQASQPSESLERKLEYLANLSHEIRTPVTSILGYTDVLCSEEISPEEQLAHLETIRRNGDHLLAVVRDVLDLTRLDAGRVALTFVETDLPDLVLDVADMLRGCASEKGLTIEVRARGPVPATIETDPTRLRQILINLVSNAVKFTDAGAVSLVVGTDGDQRTLVVDVVDRGPGLSADEQAVIFEPWMQGEAATGAGSGSGLGLAVARGLATALGGTLDVREGDERGSTFRLTVPVGTATGPSELLEPQIAFVRARRSFAHPTRDWRLRGRVLLVEDGADTRQIVAHFLRHVGCDVTTAVNGGDAIDAIGAATATGRSFDVVVMDMEMPVLDGWETTRRLRAQQFTSPIVALTAYGEPERVAACLEAGCDEVLHKPATRDEVVEAVGRYLGGAAATPDPDHTDETRHALTEIPQVHTLMRMFVQVLEQRMREMENALAADERPRIARLAHRLKGAAGSYGFVAISDAAAMLEAAAAQGEDVRGCLDRLAAMCRQAQAAYRDDGSAGSA
jgi:signal transduction histidine kinase/CheY-like chemotaxis protein/HPt (histidine-containing phosphotransfer) domain-containing protein